MARSYRDDGRFACTRASNRAVVEPITIATTTSLSQCWFVYIRANATAIAVARRGTASAHRVAGRHWDNGWDNASVIATAHAVVAVVCPDGIEQNWASSHPRLNSKCHGSPGVTNGRARPASPLRIALTPLAIASASTPRSPTRATDCLRNAREPSQTTTANQITPEPPHQLASCAVSRRTGIACTAESRTTRSAAISTRHTTFGTCCFNGDLPSHDRPATRAEGPRACASPLPPAEFQYPVNSPTIQCRT